MNSRKIETRRGTSESGPSQCSKCSTDVNETNNSILCDKCGCWMHVRCNNLPAEALNVLELARVFWFCEPCSKTMKKLTKLKNTSDVDFRAEVDVGLAEIKTVISNLQVESPSLVLSPENNSKHSDVELNRKLDMEFIISVYLNTSILTWIPKQNAVILWCMKTEMFVKYSIVWVKINQVSPITVVWGNLILFTTNLDLYFLTSLIPGLFKK